MEMVSGINKNVLSKAFIEREREIYADSKDKEKKRKKRNFSRKNLSKINKIISLKISTA